MSLQKQDLVLAIYLLADDKPWTYQSLSDVMGISSSQVHSAWKRLVISSLADKTFKKPIKRNLLEFLCHGAKYSFPAEMAGSAIGMLTAHSSPFVNKKIKANRDDRIIWTSSTGKHKGICLDPIHKSAILVAKKSEKSYQILATLDSIRIGNARETQVAISLMEEIING